MVTYNRIWIWLWEWKLSPPQRLPWGRGRTKRKGRKSARACFFSLSSPRALYISLSPISPIIPRSLCGGERSEKVKKDTGAVFLALFLLLNLLFTYEQEIPPKCTKKNICLMFWTNAVTKIDGCLQEKLVSSFLQNSSSDVINKIAALWKNIFMVTKSTIPYLIIYSYKSKRLIYTQIQSKHSERTLPYADSSTYSRLDKTPFEL